MVYASEPARRDRGYFQFEIRLKAEPLTMKRKRSLSSPSAERTKRPFEPYRVCVNYGECVSHVYHLAQRYSYCRVADATHGSIQQFRICVSPDELRRMHVTLITCMAQ